MLCKDFIMEDDNVSTLSPTKSAIQIYTDVLAAIKGQNCKDISRALSFVQDEVHQKHYAIQESQYANKVMAQADCCTGGIGLHGGSSIQDVKF